MRIKSVEIRGITSANSSLRSLANSFNLHKNKTLVYRMPKDDATEIASYWKDVGGELRIALNDYGKRQTRESHKITAK